MSFIPLYFILYKNFKYVSETVRVHTITRRDNNTKHVYITAFRSLHTYANRLLALRHGPIGTVAEPFAP